MRPRKPPPVRESAIELRCREIAEAAGGYLLKWVSPGNNGIMDRVLIMPGGVVVFMEFKRPGEPLEPLQAVWQRRFRERGHYAVKIDTVVDFQIILQRLLKERP